MRIFAVVDSLKYLKMGGRLSGSAAFIGTLLGIKPLIEVKQGKVNAIARIRGEKNIIKTLLEHFQNAKPDLSYGVSFGKESRDSPRKVDAYAALMLAHEALVDYRARGKKQVDSRTGRSWFR